MFIVRMGTEALSSSSRLLLAVSVSVLTAGIALLGAGIRRQLRTRDIVDPADPLCPLADTRNSSPASGETLRVLIRPRI